jgi:hypothetical protein
LDERQSRWNPQTTRQSQKGRGHFQEGRSPRFRQLYNLNAKERDTG